MCSRSCIEIEVVKIEQPSITVLMSVKNSMRTIERCLDSIRDVEYSNFRVVVVDNMSDDGTYEFMKSKYDNLKNFKLLQLDGTVPSVYNKAMEKINSEYTVVTDGDVEVEKDWLKELVRGLDQKPPEEGQEVVAVAGIALNPKEPESELQELIGRELEERYKNFGKFISRAATMNLLIKTDVMKKLRWRENLPVAYDTDFGYRLTDDKTKLISYNPKAIIYHYHRPTWKGFFRQQKKYAKTVPILYWEHKDKSKGDHVSKSNMILQPFTLGLGLLSFMVGFVTRGTGFHVLGGLILLFTWNLWYTDIKRISRNWGEFIFYHKMFMMRNIAWLVGLIEGIPVFLKYLMGGKKT